MKSATKKIAFVVNSLSKGGAERSNSLLTKIFTDLNYEVYIISVLPNIDFSYKGVFIPLGNDDIKNSLLRKLNKTRHLFELFINNDFHCVIDSRSRPTFIKELIYRFLIYRKNKVIYIVRSSFFRNYFPKYNFQTKLLYAKSDKIVTVSKKIKQLIKDKYDLLNVRCIYNTYGDILSNINNLQVENNSTHQYILFYGRIENKSKNLLFLLESYAQSQLIKKGINLLLLGSGPDVDILEKKTIELGIQNKVLFKGFTNNPFEYVLNSLFTVMTSNYEGFPRSIIEPLALGVPVVSLDFVSGPSEVIVTGKNGILVKEKSIESFTSALNKMINDKEFYNGCKNNCKETVKKFEMSQIAKEWEKLLQQI